MATKTFSPNADATINSTLPNSNDGLLRAMGVGLLSVGGFNQLYRGLAKFVLDWTDVASITSAVLFMRSGSDGGLSWQGASPGQIVQRVTSSWTETGVTWNTQPTVTATGQAVGAMGGAFSVWYSVDITDIVKAWAPTSIPGGGGLTNYGILLKGDGEASVSDGATFSTRESPYPAYIVLTYTSNNAPLAPTLNSPANGAIIDGSDLTPDLNFTPDDPDGDTCTKYHLQVSTSPSFSGGMIDDLDVSGSFADGVPVVRATSTLARGTTYYWRVKFYDGQAWGPYANARSFKVNSLPTAALVSPTTSLRIAKMVRPAESGWTAPRMEVSWTFTDTADPTQGQTQYEVQIATSTTPTASGGAANTNIVSGTVVSSAKTATPTPSPDFVVNNYYFVRVRVFDGVEWSAFTSYVECKVAWGLEHYSTNLGGAPVSWSISELSTTEGATQNIEVEYNSFTSGAGTPTDPWRASLAAVAKQQHFYYRVWFFSWGASPASSPTFNKMVLQYWAQLPQPDFWLPNPISGSGGSIEFGLYVFGNQCLKIVGNGTNRTIYQQVKVEPYTDYILQGRVASTGDSGACLALADTGTGTPLVSTTALTATRLFQDEPDVTAIWNSGGRSSVYVQCRLSGGAAGTAGFFDAVMLSKGHVALAYAPKLLGSIPNSDRAPAVLDAGGIIIDGSAGGVFRYLGTNPSSDRDQVRGGAKGLSFGDPTDSPVQLSSDVAGQLLADGAILSKRSSLGTSWFAGNQSGDADHRMRVGSLGPSNKTALMLGDGSVAPADGIYYNAADDLRVVDSDVNMLWRQMVVLGPFFVSNLAAGTTVDLDLANLVTTGARTRIPWSCDIVGMSVRSSAAVTAGTVTFKPTIGGVAGTLSAQLNTTDTQNKAATQGLGVDAATTTQVVGVTVTSSAGFTPAGSVEFVVFLYLALVKG